MERIHHGKPRVGWEDQITSEGIVFNKTPDENGDLVTYWREGPHYVLPWREYELLERASEDVYQMCIAAGDFMLDNPTIMLKMGIPEWAFPEIKRTWDTDAFSVYGRFDWRFGGDCELAAQDPSLRVPKLLEFNADTPTTLPESAISQWNWFEQGRMLGIHGGKDQWNGLHESLIKAWQRQVERYERATERTVKTIHFAYTADEQAGEDLMNTVYLASTAEAAGYKTKVFYIENLRTSVSDDDGSFYYVDPDDESIEILFKLYPWEWMTNFKEFNGYNTSPLLRNGTTWVEPAYKMLWSNKGLLPVLWHLFRDDPQKSQYLLPAYFSDDDHDMADFVRKPILGREGANVTFYRNNEPVLVTPGEYGEEGFVDQAYAELPNFRNPYSGEANHPLLGVWMVDENPRALGIRESEGLVTNNLSHFVPHVLID